jgi:hypothetical protein
VAASVKKFLLTLTLITLILGGSAFIDSTHFGLAQAVNTSSAFTIKIVASINNYSSTCVLVANPDASINYSSKYDSYAFYPNSGGVYAYIRYYNSTTFRYEKLSQYIVPTNGSTIWHLEVENIDQEGILTINWSSGIAFGSLIFEDGIINQIVYADMNEVGNFSYRAIGGGVSDFDIVYQSANTTPEPLVTPANTPTSTLNVSLAESASALNYGNRINFTVSADGGTKPYTYAWYIDNQMAETSNAPYFSTDSQTVGSHHVYVQVTDADNNSANTLTIEFNVLPASNSSPGISSTSSSSPTQQPTPTQTAEPSQASLVMTVVIVVVIGSILLVVLIIVGLIRYIVKSKKLKS